MPARCGARRSGPKASHALRSSFVTALALALVLVTGGCGGAGQSALKPHSRAARDITDLWWWMLLIAGIVLVGALGTLFLSWVRRGREGLPLLGKREGASTWLVVAFGIFIPLAVLIPLFVVADVVVVRDTEAPAQNTTSMTIAVTGRQWFWAIRYPGTPAVTANEIHIPVRTRVNVVADTADVIHSLWVPQLNRKIDMIPGQTNRVLLYADRPGVYRGQCSEFCGLQHAHMSFYVYADPPARFKAWLANMSLPAPRPLTPVLQKGARVFQSSQCASCHQIRGTAAHGLVGPDLTHLATRSTLAALTIPNQRADLAGWVRDPQHVKPGNKMPGLNLRSSDFQALISYLQSLR